MSELEQIKNAERKGVATALLGSALGVCAAFLVLALT